MGQPCSRVIGHAGALGQDDCGNIAGIRQGATRPIGRHGPESRAATDPGHRRELRDVGRGAALVADVVVSHIGSAVAAGQRHRFTKGSVLVSEDAGRRNADRVTTDQAAVQRVGRAHRGKRGSVVGLVGGCDAAHRQCRRCDVGRGAFLYQGVVQRIGSAQAQATGGDDLGRAHILVGKRSGGGASQGDRVAAQGRHSGRAGETCDHRRVINPAGGAQANHRQCRRCDVGRGAFLYQGVVQRIGSAQAQATGGDDLGRAHILVGKRSGGGASQGDRVAAQGRHSGRAGETCDHRRVINPAGGAQANHRQCRRCDIGRGAFLQQGVVACAAAAQAQARGGDDLGRAHILVGEGSRGRARQADHITTQGGHRRRSGQCCAQPSVIYLADCAESGHRQRRR